ncbi:alpha/beta fold hydrolase [Ramlibacter sp. G-1-2-2]|uniref:Alpha/beta fold hydrolase n=1 Tax=Ramlibacter agri TaxID=2728837 RepID=A0A848HB48_9BURK|nr:alpha/beta fold hydrolase [Ramlibacter agri]
MKVRANGLDIEVESTGPAGAPAVLLVMGLGMQLTAWPSYFTDPLLAAGYRVIRFDNRDAGLSQALDHLGVPNILWESLKLKLGLPVRTPYRLHDLAADALGVLDALGVQRAHVVGASMGGMVAQRVALAAPERVLSLTSIMSTSGARRLPGPRSDVLRALVTPPRDRSEAGRVEHGVRFFQLIGSPGFPTPEPELRERVRESMQRSYRPAGTARQLAAVAADTRRAAELAQVRARTLVVHGRDDPLVPLAAGEDTARRIPGARLVTIPGMAHDLPRGVVERLLQDLLPHLG